MVQWLRIHASTAGGLALGRLLGLTLGWETKIPSTMQHGQKIKKRKEGGETNHTHAYTPVPSSPTSVDVITAKETIGRKERRRKADRVLTAAGPPSLGSAPQFPAIQS